MRVAPTRLASPHLAATLFPGAVPLLRLTGLCAACSEEAGGGKVGRMGVLALSLTGFMRLVLGLAACAAAHIPHTPALTQWG